MQLATDHGVKPDSLITDFVVYNMSAADPHYKALCNERKSEGIECFCVISDGKSCGPSRVVVLETNHVFGNQWNSKPDAHSEQGYRLFNWFEHYRDYGPNKRGHYLKITPEMRELCRLTHVCGYCGAEYYGIENASKFCSACLDSGYLEKKNLHLLRLMPVDINGRIRTDRPELTEEELAWLMPIYVERQTTGTNSRNAARLKKQREDIEHKFEVEMANAKTERDGLIWLMDHNISIDNVIYYNHTAKFSFGWRSPIGAEVKSKLLNVLSEFPFDYEIK